MVLSLRHESRPSRWLKNDFGIRINSRILKFIIFKYVCKRDAHCWRILSNLICDSQDQF